MFAPEDIIKKSVIVIFHTVKEGYAGHVPL